MTVIELAGEGSNVNPSSSRSLVFAKQSLATALDLVGLPEALQLLAEELEARQFDTIDDALKTGSDAVVRAIVQRHAERILNVLDAITTPSI